MSIMFEESPDLESVSNLENDEFVGSFNSTFGDIDFNSLGIDPQTSTEAKPGSEEKVLMLAARYAAGLPLWNHEDCYDHAPTDLFDHDDQDDDEFEYIEIADGVEM